MAEGAYEASRPSPGIPSSNIHMSSCQKVLPSPKISEFYGGFIKQASLIKSLATDDQYNIESLSPPWRFGVASKVPTL